MREVVAALLNKMPSPISFRGIAKETQGYSYKLVQEYLDVLRGLRVHERDERSLLQKGAQGIFRDLLLMHIFSFLSGIRPFESVIYENVMQGHIYRKFGEVYYYKNL